MQYHLQSACHRSVLGVQYHEDWSHESAFIDIHYVGTRYERSILIVRTEKERVCGERGDLA